MVHFLETVAFPAVCIAFCGLVVLFLLGLALMLIKFVIEVLFDL